MHIASKQTNYTQCKIFVADSNVLHMILLIIYVYNTTNQSYPDVRHIFHSVVL